MTGSLVGSSMAENEAFSVIESPFGPLGLLQPLVPDVALVHAAAADPAGNLAFSEPLLDGVWGAWAARRGVVATVERVVDDLDGLGHRVRVPGHRVLAVVEAPYGAHPGGCYAPGLPVRSYGEDIAHWSAVAAAAAHGELDDYVEEWVLGPATHEDYLTRVGTDHLLWLEGRSDPMSWKADADANPVVEDHAFTQWEQAASLGAREVERVVGAGRTPTRCWPGPGVANLAAWVAVARARAGGSRVTLTAELGLWGYEPTPADPYIFNQRVFPATPYLSDASAVLGMVIGGPGHRDGGLPGRGGGRQRRAPELDRAGGWALPGRLGRRQRRRQPGHGLRGRDAGPTRTAARAPRPTSLLRGSGSRASSPIRAFSVARTACSGWPRCPPGTGRWRSGCVRSRPRAGTSPTSRATWRSGGGEHPGGAARCESSTGGGCSWHEVARVEVTTCGEHERLKVKSRQFRDVIEHKG